MDPRNIYGIKPSHSGHHARPGRRTFGNATSDHFLVSPNTTKLEHISFQRAFSISSSSERRSRTPIDIRQGSGHARLATYDQATTTVLSTQSPLPAQHSPSLFNFESLSGSKSREMASRPDMPFFFSGQFVFFYENDKKVICVFEKVSTTAIRISFPLDLTGTNSILTEILSGFVCMGATFW